MARLRQRLCAGGGAALDDPLPDADARGFGRDGGGGGGYLTNLVTPARRRAPPRRRRRNRTGASGGGKRAGKRGGGRAGRKARERAVARDLGLDVDQLPPRMREGKAAEEGEGKDAGAAGADAARPTRSPFENVPCVQYGHTSHLIVSPLCLYEW